MRERGQGTASGKGLVMAGWTKAPEVHFSPFSPPAKSLTRSAEGDGKCSLGLLLISSSGTGSYCVCTGGSSNLNTVIALLMVLALADSRAQPGTQQQECLWSPARATELQSLSCAGRALIPAGAGVLGCPVLAQPTQARFLPMPSLSGEGSGWSHLREVKVAGHGHGPGHRELGMGLDMSLGLDQDLALPLWWYVGV